MVVVAMCMSRAMSMAVSMVMVMAMPVDKVFSLVVDHICFMPQMSSCSIMAMVSLLAMDERKRLSGFRVCG